MKSNKREIKSLRDLQRENINSDYSCGLYNGLEIALAVIESREPELATYEADQVVTEGEEEKPGRTLYSGVRRRNGN